MEKKEKLVVTAKYGSQEFQETAWPYNKNVHEAQVEDCLNSIRRQIIDAGKAEMMDAFLVQKPQIIEEEKRA